MNWIERSISLVPCLQITHYSGKVETIPSYLGKGPTGRRYVSLTYGCNIVFYFDKYRNYYPI